MSDSDGSEVLPNLKPLKSWVILLLFPYAAIFFALLIILPAGKWDWIEGWLYIFIFCLIIEIYYQIINRKNPAVIRNRMKIKKTGVTKEIKKEASSDKWILLIMGISGFGTWIIPGLNERYGWTEMPLALSIVGFIITIVGTILFNQAQLENAYASKLLDINEGQKLIDTGLYAHVRHPLYSGACLLFIGTPLALGSWFSFIPATISIACLFVRIKFEEAMLIKGMEGYKDYRTRVKYKIIPKLI